MGQYDLSQTRQAVTARVLEHADTLMQTSRLLVPFKEEAERLVEDTLLLGLARVEGVPMHAELRLHLLSIMVTLLRRRFPEFAESSELDKSAGGLQLDPRSAERLLSRLQRLTFGQLRSAFLSLPAPVRLVTVLLMALRLRYRQIAEITATEMKEVRITARRGRRQLQRELLSTREQGGQDHLRMQVLQDQETN